MAQFDNEQDRDDVLGTPRESDIAEQSEAFAEKPAAADALSDIEASLAEEPGQDPEPEAAPDPEPDEEASLEAEAEPTPEPEPEPDTEPEFPTEPTFAEEPSIFFDEPSPFFDQPALDSDLEPEDVTAQISPADEQLAALVPEPVMGEVAAPEAVPAPEPAPLPAPAAATIATGSTVVLIVSTGGDIEAAPMDLASAPDVLFRKQEDALRIVDDVGMSARVYFDLPYSKGVAPGTVQAQAPDAGRTTRYGTPLVLMLATGSVKDAGERVELPDVVGMDEDDAVAKVRAAGLIPEVVYQEVAHATVAAGMVALQLPDAASLALATAKKRRRWGLVAAIIGVVLLIAAAAAAYAWYVTPIPVPRVEGMQQADAQRELKDAGFAVGEIEFKASSETTAGVVLEQDPQEKTKLQRGSAVDLTVAGGAEIVAVPQLVGQTREQAVSALDKASLEATVSESYDASIPKGAVIQQAPLEGEHVEVGTTVRLLVSTGPRPRNATVPIVDGKNRDVARSSLESVGLVPYYVATFDSSVGSGLVITTLPAPGTAAFIGDPVILIMSVGARPSDMSTRTVSVPDVRNTDVDSARNRLVQSRLLAAAVEIHSDVAAVGRVIGQYPAPGVTRREGDTVVLVVSRGKLPAE